MAARALRRHAPLCGLSHPHHRRRIHIAALYRTRYETWRPVPLSQTFLPAQMAFDTAPISSTPIADTTAEHPITWTKPVYAGSVKQFSVPGPLVFHMGAEPTELDRLCPPSQTTGSRQIGCSSLRPVASEPRSGALARDLIWQWACSVVRESESLKKRRSVDSDLD